MVELGGPIQLSSPIASTSNIAAPSSSLGSSSNRTGPPTRPLPPREDELQAAKSNGQVTESELRQLDESRGAIVHTLNPDAPSTGAPTLSQLHPLRDLAHNDPKGGLKELSIDMSSAGHQPIPTVTIEDLDETSRLEGQGVAGEVVPKQSETQGDKVSGHVVGVDKMPGSIPAASTPEGSIPDWYKVGWRSVSGVDEPRPTSTTAERSLLAEWVSEQSYGTMYHNAGVIFFAVVISRFMGLFHLGWGWTIILLAFCAAYYDLSITRVRRAARDDIQRELVKTRLVTESESADWINSFLHRFWKIYEPVLSATIVASVDSVLSTSTPAFLESIKMTTFTLGNKAPRIESIRTHPNTDDSEVLMDWKLSFTPNDVSDVTPNQQRFQTNPKIVLEIKVGKGFISAPLPILLEDITFVGHMRIKLKLMSNFPHVQTVGLSFLEKPTFDYVLKPLTGFDINNIPGLSSFVQDQVHAILGPMMYDPNVFTLNLEQLLNGAPLDTAIGVLQLTITSARGLKANKIGGGAPDPYVNISLAGREAVARTATRRSDYNPAWNEVKHVLVTSLADVLTFQVLDYNTRTKDTELGTATFELSKLEVDASLEGLTTNILDEGRVRGELRFDANFFPVLKPAKLADGTLDVVPESRTGICRLTIHQAKDLEGTHLLGGNGGGVVNPYAKLFLGSSREPVHKTGIFKSNHAPSWESSHEFLVTDKNASVISVQVINDVDFLKDPMLGKVVVSLKDLLTAKERQQDWFPLQGAKTGRIRLSAEWKPLAMAGSLNGSAAYVPPIGVIRVLFKHAKDVKNVEAALGGKSDPYVRVLSGGNTMARTHVINNDLNPVWDQMVYFPVHNLRERPIFELMDYQHLTKDRSLGTLEIDLAELAVEIPDNKTTPFVSTGRKLKDEKLRLDRKGAYKGSLCYEIDFSPAYSLKGGVSFVPKEDEISAAIHQADRPTTPSTAATTNPSPKSPPANLPMSPLSVISPISPTTMSGSGDDEATPNEDKSTGIELTREEILRTPSGILVCQVVSGSIERRARLEVLLDDGYWPSFSTPKARSTHATWDSVGEAFVKELDLGRITLRLNQNDDGQKEDIVASLEMDAKLFLDQSLDTPQDFTLLASDGSGRKSVVKICSKFIPVDIVLAPRESANNQGTLRVELVDAEGLRAADRSGKSDPYAVFTLAEERVFKSETKKKTLAPVWNESFQVDIPSRVAAAFNVEVFDWDQIGTATSLGVGHLDLAKLEPFEAINETITLSTTKHGVKGSVRVRLVFQPAIIVKSRKNTSTFSTAGRAVTQVGSIPLGVGKGVAKGALSGVVGVGHGVGAVGGFAGRKIGLVRKKDKHGKEVLVEDVIDDNGSVLQSDGASIETNGISASDFATHINGAGSHDGTLKVTLVSAVNVPEEAKYFASAVVGDKTHKSPHSAKTTTPVWESTSEFALVSANKYLVVSIFEHKSLGRDRAIGSAEVEIFKHISLAMPSTDLEVPLRDGPTLKLRLHFQSIHQAAHFQQPSHHGDHLPHHGGVPTSPRQGSSSSNRKSIDGKSASRFLRRGTKGEKDRPEDL